MKNTTIQKFADKTAKIGIVGLDYVGLPLMLRDMASLAIFISSNRPVS